MFLLQKRYRMSVFIVLGVVTNVLLSLTESAPMIHFSLKFFLPLIFFYKITAYFTLELDHHLLPSLFLARAVQPSHCLVLAIAITLPLLKSNVIHTSLLDC